MKKDDNFELDLRRWKISMQFSADPIHIYIYKCQNFPVSCFDKLKILQKISLIIFKEEVMQSVSQVIFHLADYKIQHYPQNKNELSFIRYQKVETFIIFHQDDRV